MGSITTTHILYPIRKKILKMPRKPTKPDNDSNESNEPEDENSSGKKSDTPDEKNDKTIRKKSWDPKEFLKSQKMDKPQADKELSWIPLSKAWHDAIKLPGFPRGYVSLVRGYSNTGKSTAFYEALAGAQKIGDFSFVIETEGNWNWEHAIQLGVKCERKIDEKTGEVYYMPDNFMVISNAALLEKYENYNHQSGKWESSPIRSEAVIEDVSYFIGEMLQMQDKGEIQANLCFLWDSIGTLNCFKSAISLTSNNQWNAGALGVFQTIVNFKIPSSRAKNKPYINTFIAVQKIWLDNMNGSVIKHKGGEFFFYNARLIVHLGGILTHGTKKLNAVALGHKFQFGTQAKIKCEKNHVTGIEREGEIASTPHGYINPLEIEAYKKEHRKFIHEALNVSYDEVIDFSEEDELRVD